MIQKGPTQKQEKPEASMTPAAEEEAQLEDACFCRLPFPGHPRCDACNILVGESHIFSPIEFRGKIICAGCVRRWELRDRQLGRKSSFKEMIEAVKYNVCSNCLAMVKLKLNPQEQWVGRCPHCSMLIKD